MARKANFHNIDAVILCGGLGTRLKPILGDTPKGLAEVSGKPILEIIVRKLLAEDFSRIILAVGHLKEQIIQYFSSPNFQSDRRKIFFSEEEKPLGTGGALKRAAKLIKSKEFLVLNGDCIYSIDFNEFYAAHLEHKAILSMALARVPDAASYGSVILASDKKSVQRFGEKNTGKDCLVNAGAYFMNREVFKHMPQSNAFSLERDFFPTMIGRKFYGFSGNYGFLDIGVPERYEEAKQLVI